MIIRKATPNDAQQIAPLLLLAMEEIVYAFIQEKSYPKALAFMTHFVSLPSNQYSYDCTWVIEDNGKIIGATNVYDGAQLHPLREPIAEYIRSNFGFDFTPEDETQSGEMYLDCIGVDPNYQGQGLGSKLLKHLIEQLVQKEGKTLGLLVEIENPKAEQLYLKTGFQPVGYKTLVGKKLKHLQYLP